MSKKKLIILIVLPFIIFFASLLIGRYPVSLITVFQVLLSKIFPIEPTWVPTAETVIFQVRLPRAIIALAVGSSLAISGSSFQGMFQNPLVSSQILGVSAGAGFGAALAIIIGGNGLVVQLFAFCGGILAVFLAYMISRIHKTTPTLMLVLAGFIVGALFSALISLLEYIADPYDQLPAIVFWLMGSLSTSSLKDLVYAIPPIAFGTVGLLLVRWRINILSMGDEQARSLGVNTEPLKLFIIFCCTIITAASVCVSGIIGWIGLVIPHIARMIVGPNHKVLLPASISLGASYLLVIDNIARTITTAEIPLSILTAIVGAPFFAYLLRRTRGGMEGK